MDQDRYNEYPGERRSTSQPRSGSGSGGAPSGAGRSGSSSGRTYDGYNGQSTRGQAPSGGSGYERGATPNRTGATGSQYGGYERGSAPTRSGSADRRYEGYDRGNAPSRSSASGSQYGYDRGAASPGRSASAGGSQYSAGRSSSASGSGGSRGYTGGSSGAPRKKKKKRRYRLRIQPRAFFILSITLVVIAMIIVGINAFGKSQNPQAVQASSNPGLFSELFKTPTPSPTPTPTPTPTPSPTPPYEIPHAVDSTQPSVYGITTAVEENGTKVDSYQRLEKIEFLPDVPYTMYFYSGYGIHGTYWHHNFGTPMSHGCINMRTSDAAWLYSWSVVGTPVVIHY